MMDQSIWASGIESELAFWKHWLDTNGGQWPDDFIMRADPGCPLQEEISRHVQAPLDAPLKILDVGAGPMTYVGKTFHGAPIDLVSVDALGDHYRRLEFPSGLPLVRTQTCDSEALTAKFPENSFDVVFSRNALDHGYDPIKAVLEMIAVAKPGGIVVTLNWTNEAIRENWQGFHQWNFEVIERDFLVSNRDQSFNVREIVAGLVDILELSAENSGFVYCVMRKKAMENDVSR